MNRLTVAVMLIAGLAYGDVHKPLTLIQGRVTPLPLNDSLVDAQAYNILDFGAKCDGTTDDTAAIQRALDAAGVTFGVVFVPSTSTGCLFTNLKLSPYTKLRGDHMRQSNLTRKAGSTGTGIREKTAGEGNAAGATGIWIQDLWIDGNSTTGDGIDIGSQNLTFQLSTMAGMSHVAVWRFSGICIKLSSNASSFEYLWADLCATGIKATGGIANTFHSVFAEFNTTNDIDLTDSNDSLFGVQIEEDRNGTNPAILVEGSDNLLEGVFIALGIDKTVLVRNAAGANRNTYRDVSIYPNGHTWTNLILDSTWSVGTGSTNLHIAEFVVGESSSASSWYINQSTGHTAVRSADLTNHYQLQTGWLGIGTTPSSTLLDVEDHSTANLGLIYHNGGAGTIGSNADMVEIRSDDTSTYHNLLKLDLAGSSTKLLTFDSDGLLYDRKDFRVDGATQLNSLHATTNAVIDGALTASLHIRTTGVGVAFSSCGSTPSPVCNSSTCNDISGTFTTGGTATACTITFAGTYTGADDAACIMWRSGSTSGPTYTVSATAINVTVDVATTKYTYICLGHQT